MSSYEQNDGVRLMDVIKLFWKKILWILLALFIGVAAGATYGFVHTKNNKVYGAKLEFFVNPKTANQENQQIYGVYGSVPIAEMIGQLKADSFSEYLFLDEDGLPAKGISAEVDAKVEAAQAVLANEEATKEEKKTAVQAAVEAWQQTDDYNQWISAVKAATVYTRGISDEETSSVATSFIYVDIQVKNNEAFAKVLRDKLVEKVPVYVEDNMYVPTETIKNEQGENVPKFVGTNCSRMSRTDEVVCLTDGKLFSTLVKNGVLFGFATTAVACVVILIMNFGTLNKKEEQPTTEIA